LSAGGALSRGWIHQNTPFLTFHNMELLFHIVGYCLGLSSSTKLDKSQDLSRERAPTDHVPKQNASLRNLVQRRYGHS
jgi:hypothetical protein